MVNNKTGVLVVDDNQMVEQANAANKPSLAMDAIAIGIETKLDPFFAYSKIVTQRTIGVAQQLGVSEEEVQQWAASRAKLESERKRAIKSEFNRDSTSAILV
jgi:hypothetical protein